ncbi:hypothetical protein HZS_2492 [Henneguya salminicola]|nr:hypothetical protein HZS_2492 [Henneguya salminicola]
MYRIVQILRTYVSLQASNDASLRQAKHLSSQYMDILRDKESSETKKSDDKSESQKDKLIDELRKEIDALKVDKTTLITQSKSLDKEYDRLLKEHALLQEKFEKTGNKKDD